MSDIESTIEQHVKVATSRERSIREHQESLALQDKLHLRAELNLQRMELASANGEIGDARMRLSRMHASEASLEQEVEH